MSSSNKKNQAEEGRPLLAEETTAAAASAASAAAGYGGTGDGTTTATTTADGSNYPTAAGYCLTPAGLAAVVSEGQLGAVDAFGGTAGLAAAVGCQDVKSGISTAKEEGQQRRYGSNASSPPAVPSLLGLYWEGLKDPTILMLLCSSAVSLILGLGVERDFQNGWIEGTSISVTVFLVVSVSALTDYAKAKAFSDQLVQLENKKHATVVRNRGTMERIHPSRLVVGDVLLLSVGDICPVDGILLQGSSSDMKMDESALTGETDLIEKDPYVDGQSTSKSSIDPFIISGTNVMLGTGKMLVLAVGSNSIQGKILARIREDDDDDSDEHRHDDDDSGGRGGCWSAAQSFFTLESFTGGGDSGAAEGADLMGKLDVMAMDIGKVGLLVAALVFVVLLVSWLHSQIVAGRACPGLSGEGETACLENVRCSWQHGEGEAGLCSSKKVRAEDFSVVLQFFITGVTILVVAVPEGLPLAVTLALAVSIGRMMKDHNQVKHMDSCETMGSATTICSDKTGTLTENRMTVTRLRAFDRDYEYVVGGGGGGGGNNSGSGNKSVQDLGHVILAGKDETTPLTDLIAESMLLNCAPTSKVVSDGQHVKYEGNATECALIKLTMQLGYSDPDEVRSSFRETDASGGLDWGVYAFPFSSEQKRMSWIVRLKNKGNKKSSSFRMYSKGAPQQLFAVCSQYVSDVAETATATDAVKVQSLTPSDRTAFEDKVNEYQKAGLRSLAIAYKDFDCEPAAGWKSVAFDGLALLCVVGIEDPLRPSVPAAIADCRKAGIDVRMCTGDALATGVAIAKGCGILRDRDLISATGEPKKNFAMTGAEFDDRVHRKDYTKPKAVRRVYDAAINDAVDTLAEPFLLDAAGNKVIDQEAFDDIWPTLRVLARCQPEDKLTLVRGMRKSKVFMDERRCEQLLRDHGIAVFPDFQVVAVTGDGTNDAPALKSANVGFAMGIVGTETAKQACDIILLDDNFASIIKAVLWGRNVFDSISKFLQFQLTVNVVAITLATVGAFAYAESPLTAVQMLWINMIMDSLASLALATELPTQELLERAPYGRRRPIISRVMGTNIVGHSAYQIVVLFWVLFAPATIPVISVEYEPYQGSRHWSVFFNVFVMLQLFNEFNSRRLVSVPMLVASWREWNVFDGVCSNALFVLIMVSTFVLQIVIVQFGGQAVNIVAGGLNRGEWIFCVAAGACGLLWQLVLNAVMAVLYKKQEITAKKRSVKSADEEIASMDMEEQHDGEHWDKLRFGVRQGFVYAKMFRISFRKGYKLHKLVQTSLQDKKQRQRRASLQMQTNLLKRLADVRKKKKKKEEEGGGGDAKREKSE